MIGCDTTYYNYYNLDRYSPEKPTLPAWKENLQLSNDGDIHSNNYDPDSPTIRAFVQLEEAYYQVSIENRARFSDANELKRHIWKKYMGRDSQYSGYTKTERETMYRNELQMSLFGCLNGGGRLTDPHVTVKLEALGVDKAYNKKKVNEQIERIANDVGIKDTRKLDISFTIDPVTYHLRVFGMDDDSNKEEFENALNTGYNSTELFYYILKNYPQKPIDDIMLKYRIMREYYMMTGDDLRDYTITSDGFFDEDGNNALDIFKQRLLESKKDYAKEIFGDFMRRLTILQDKGFHSIPDAYLRMGFREGSLYEIMDEQLYQTAIAYQA